MKDCFIQGLSRLAERDRNVVLLTADLGFGFFEQFAARFPGQALNVGVAEQNMIGIATGMALSGKIVFCYSIANFATLRCLEQIRNDACYHEANVKVVAMGTGFSYGQLGISHHATEDVGILRALPGMTLCSPGCDWECEEAVLALGATHGTCCIRLDKTSAGNTRQVGEKFSLGKIREVRQGDDLTLICTGGILKVALNAAEELGQRGVQLRVLSAPTLKPFDRDAVIFAARNTGGVITLEEHTLDGGLGSIVAESLLDAGVFPRSFARMGLRDGFSCVVGSQEYLRERYEISARHVVERVMEMVKLRGEPAAHQRFGDMEIAV